MGRREVPLANYRKHQRQMDVEVLYIVGQYEYQLEELRTLLKRVLPIVETDEATSLGDDIRWALAWESDDGDSDGPNLEGR